MKLLNLLLLSLFTLTHFVAGQTPNNVLTGRVLDENGNAVAGASVTLSAKATRFERQMTTNANGVFTFANVIAGSYQITATAENFGTIAREASVGAGQSDSFELVLRPAEIAETVSVQANYLAGTPESLTEIPGSIDKIDERTLENSRVFNFSEALRKASGVNVRDEEGFGLRPNIGIRGTNPTRSTKILLLEDGIPLAYAPYGDNASYYHPPIERYESIEILKGSGQIAYGPQTIAGVVNYITPNPSEEQIVTFGLEGGNRSFFRGNLGYSNTFGKTGVLFNFTRKQGEGARENLRHGLNDFSSKIVRQINDRNVLTGKFSWYGEDSNITYSGLTEAEYAANPRGNIFRNDFFYANRFGTSLSHTMVLTSRANLTTNFYANNFSRHWWRQSSNSNERPNRLRTLSGGDPDCFGLQDLNTTCGNQGRLRNYWTVGIEPHLNIGFDLGTLRNDFSAGFRYQYEDQNRRQENGNLPNSRDGVLAEDNERKAKAISGFVQNRFILGNLAVTPGLRIEKINFSRTNRLANNGAGVRGETDVTEIIPGIGAAYTAFGNTTFFAGIHRGFAPPRAEDVVSNTGGVIELDSELSWNYEIGVRAKPMRGVSIESAFFRNDYENQIVAASIAGGAGATLTNGGETLQQGFEFNGQIDTGTILRSPHNFYFRAAYTFLPIAEFRGTRFSSITASAILNSYCPPERRASASACSVSGNRLPYVPKTLLTASFGYSHPIGFDAFVENVYIGRQFGDDLNAVNPTANGQLGAIQAQTSWNATANYKIERWKTTLFVTAKNIFDRTYIVDRSRGILPSSPRLVMTGVKVNF